MRVITTACNDRYAPFALNLISSLKTKSNYKGRIIVYNLGMSSLFKFAFKNIKQVTVIKVPEFSPHYLACWTWKPWIYQNAPADEVLYIDAGSEALRDLEPIFKIVERLGYFVVSQKGTLPEGHYVRDIVPPEYYKKLGVSRQKVENKDVITAGIIGFRKDSPFFEKVIQPEMKYVLAGDNLGWSESELYRNSGINYLPNPPVRNCSYFRHDQTLLNLLFYREFASPVIQPMDVYAPLTKNARKKQYIWNPRRQNSLEMIGQVEYRYLRLVHRVLNKYIKKAGDKERQR